MSGRESFESRINREVQAEKRQQKATREQEAAKARKIAALNSRVSQRAAKLLRHEGTKPEEVWSDQEIAVCDDFFQYMGKIGFKGASTLANTAVDGQLLNVEFFGWKAPEHIEIPAFTVKGYAIGYAQDPERLPGENVFLCLDGQIRTSNSLRIMSKRFFKPNEEHIIYTDLPLDAQGQVVKPMMFEEEEVAYESYHSSGSGVEIPCTAYRTRFTAISLEDKLAGIAKQNSL